MFLKKLLRSNNFFQNLCRSSSRGSLKTSKSRVSCLTVVIWVSTAVNSGHGKKDCLLKSKRMKHTWTQGHLQICFIWEVIKRTGRGKSRDSQSHYLIPLFVTHPGMCTCKLYIFWIGLSLIHGFLELARFKKLLKGKYASSAFFPINCT